MALWEAYINCASQFWERQYFQVGEAKLKLMERRGGILKISVTAHHIMPTVPGENDYR